MTTVLVTGGCGFIGSNTAIELIRRDYNVKILDNLATGKLDNISDVRDSIEFFKTDIEDTKKVKKAVRDVDYVIHEAALPSVPRSIKDPIATNNANVSGTLNLLVAARDSGVKQVVYAASSSAYGDTPTLPKREDMPANPLSSYAISKYTGELYCKVFSEIYELKTIRLRYFNVFGPRQDPSSQYAAVIPKFITCMLKRESPTVFGDGTQSRDFTFIDDVVEANILAMRMRKTRGELVNIASGRQTTINQLIDEINSILGSDIKPVYTNSRPGDVKHSLADISQARKLLGYKPKHDLKTGLKKTVEWFSK